MPDVNLDFPKMQCILGSRIVKPEIWTIAMGQGPTAGDIILESVNMPVWSWLAD